MKRGGNRVVGALKRAAAFVKKHRLASRGLRALGNAAGSDNLRRAADIAALLGAGRKRGGRAYAGGSFGAPGGLYERLRKARTPAGVVALAQRGGKFRLKKLLAPLKKAASAVKFVSQIPGADMLVPGIGTAGKLAGMVGAGRVSMRPGIHRGKFRPLL